MILLLLLSLVVGGRHSNPSLQEKADDWVLKATCDGNRMILKTGTGKLLESPEWVRYGIERYHCDDNGQMWMRLYWPTRVKETP